MINEHNFPCDCIENERICRSLASHVRVCIMSGNRTEGGDKIWPPYDRWAHGNSTTTTMLPITSTTTATPPVPPNPEPEKSGKFYKIYSIAITLTFVAPVHLLTKYTGLWKL